jgi:hypothetical protein
MLDVWNFRSSRGTLERIRFRTGGSLCYTNAWHSPVTAFAHFTRCDGACIKFIWCSREPAHAQLGSVPFSPLSLCGALDPCSGTAIVCHCHTEHIVWYHNPSSGRILPAVPLSKGTTCSGPVSRGVDRFCVGEGAMASPLYFRERSMSGYVCL